MEFKKARINMIQNGFRPNGITDPALLEAFLKVERDYFVCAPLKIHALIYENSLDLGQNRFLSNTKVYATLLQAASLKMHEKVLVLPLSCGYYGAVISHLAAHVWGLELAENQNLFDLPLKTATYPKNKLHAVLVQEGLENGYAEAAPYDVIFVDGAVEALPSHLWDQLSEGGRMVYVEHAHPDRFYGRVVYKNDPSSQEKIFTETPVTVSNHFRRTDVFKF